MSFGQWYEQQQNQQGNDNNNESSSLPFSLGNVFNITNEGGAEEGDEEMGRLIPNLSNMKQTLEQQLPSKILGMNYQQRFQAFCAMILLSILFFFLAFTIGVPMLTIRPQKFAISFSTGSLIFMLSFALLRGPHAHFSSMLEVDRLPFTTIYLTSMISTLYFCFSVGGMSGYIVVLGSSVCQCVALLWYLITFLPGGKAGLHVMVKAMLKILGPIIMGCGKIWSMIVTKCFGWLVRS